MTNNGNSFLEIEAAATNLLAHLESLREETKNNARKALEHGTASSQLSAASDLLADELLSYEETSKKLLDLINKMSSTGVPELLESFEKVSNALAELLKSSEKSAKDIEEEVYKLRRDVNESDERTTKAATSIAASIIESEEKVSSLLAELNSSNTQSKQEITREFNELRLETDMVKSGLSRHITIGILINSAVVIAGFTLVMILT